jgi:CMP-N,N'-diacetyllegionaminic acid synthase
MKIFAIIPARGGSKGVKNKNVRTLAGKPLIAHTIDAARAVPSISRVIVNTDSEDIAAVARAHGAEVFMRLPEHGTDTALAYPLIRHHLEELNAQGEMPDIVVDLRATSPLRSAARIQEGIDLLLKHGRSVDSVRAVMEAAKHPYKMWMLNEEHGLLRPLFDPHIIGIEEPFDHNRQQLPRFYQNNGAMYAIWTDTIMNKQSLTGKRVAGYVMEDWESVNIDTEIDFVLAEHLLQSKLLQ